MKPTLIALSTTGALLVLSCMMIVLKLQTGSPAVSREVTITAKASDEGIGDYYMLDSGLKIQAKQCVGFEDLQVGDTITAVLVTDKDGVLRSVTCVDLCK